MQPIAPSHKVIIISILNALLDNKSELNTKLTTAMLAHQTPTFYAPIAAARSRYKKNHSHAAPAPCPPCTNRPHRTAPHRTVPCPPFPPQSRSRDSNPGFAIPVPILYH